MAQVFTRIWSCKRADWTSRGESPSTRVHNASSAADLPPLDIDLEGAVTSEGIALVVDGVVNLASGVVEAAHWIAERGAGPILIVPEKELKRLAGLETPDGA